MAQKVTSYFGLLLSQELSKIAQSGHTDDLRRVLSSTCTRLGKFDRSILKWLVSSIILTPFIP